MNNYSISVITVVKNDQKNIEQKFIKLFQSLIMEYMMQ